MILIDKTIPLDCDIILHGDTHNGQRAFDRKGLERMLKWVMAAKNRYYVHMGDENEYILVDDNKRFNAEIANISIPLQQANDTIEIYRKSAKRCLVWLNGNHNDGLRRFGNLTRDVICRALGIDYGTWACKLALNTQRGRICKFFLMHGFRGVISSNAKDYEQQRANMMASLKRKLVHKACDCLVMACGHTHQLMVVPPAQRLVMKDDGRWIKSVYMGAGDGTLDYIEPDRRWYVNTGSFMKIYELGADTYAEKHGYDPIEIGYAVVRIRKGRVDGVDRVVIN